MCTCQIEWIDSKGVPTPDTSPAIGVAFCRTVDSEARAPGSSGYSEAYRICARHEAQAPIGVRSCYVAGRTITTEWIFVSGVGDMLAMANHHEEMGGRDALVTSLRKQAATFASAMAARWAREIDALKAR